MTIIKWRKFPIFGLNEAHYNDEHAGVWLDGHCLQLLNDNAEDSWPNGNGLQLLNDNAEDSTHNRIPQHIHIKYDGLLTLI